MNGGGIRGSINSSNGTITYGDLIIIQPFENFWDIVEMQGKYIRQVQHYFLFFCKLIIEKINTIIFFIDTGAECCHGIPKS